MRWAVYGLWIVVCVWLCVALLASVIGELFFGDGPVNASASVPPAVEAPLDPSHGS